MSTPTLTDALAEIGTREQAGMILDLIERQRPTLDRMLGARAEHFAGVIVAESRRQPRLLDCDPSAFAGAMLLAYLLRLHPAHGHVHLVPHDGAVAFVLGHYGAVELIHRTGAVRDVAAAIVRDGDTFAYREGTRPVLDHVPAGPSADREWTHAYAVARLKSGGTPFCVLYPDDVARVRDSSASARKPGSPWLTDVEGSWLKAALSQLAARLPVSDELSQALAADESSPRLIEHGADAELVIDPPIASEAGNPKDVKYA